MEYDAMMPSYRGGIHYQIEMSCLGIASTEDQVQSSSFPGNVRIPKLLRWLFLNSFKIRLQHKQKYTYDLALLARRGTCLHPRQSIFECMRDSTPLAVVDRPPISDVKSKLNWCKAI